MSKYLLNCYFRAAEQFAENMVTNNAILWEINEIVGNLRPELSTHIRLIMLRAGLTRRWSRFLLNFVVDYLKCWQTETTLQKYKRAEDVRVKFNVIKKLVDSNPSYATLFESLKDIVSSTVIIFLLYLRRWSMAREIQWFLI